MVAVLRVHRVGGELADDPVALLELVELDLGGDLGPHVVMHVGVIGNDVDVVPDNPDPRDEPLERRLDELEGDGLGAPLCVGPHGCLDLVAVEELLHRSGRNEVGGAALGLEEAEAAVRRCPHGSRDLRKPGDVYSAVILLAALMLLELSAPLAGAVPVLAEALMAVMAVGPSRGSLEPVLAASPRAAELTLAPRLAVAAGLGLIACIPVLVISIAVVCLRLFRLCRRQAHGLPSFD